MRSVLVFCEGHHDVVFAQRSLGAHSDCEWVNRQIRDLPYPFGRQGAARKGLIASRLEKQELEEAKIQAATHPAPPFFASIVESVPASTLYFLINALGKGQILGEQQVHRNIDLLRDVDLAINAVSAASPWYPNTLFRPHNFNPRG